MTNALYGASPSDWQHFATLDLTTDLLPVVSNPHARIARTSTLKGVGKTPSVYNGMGEAVGLAKWTAKQSTEREIAAWAGQDDYGICLQTRRVRALDIDVDSVLAQEIERFILDRLGALPVRSRPNAFKTLLAFRLDGDYGKRTIRVDGGMIEFLATGQQFVAVGTHPSGERYVWSPIAPDFPVIAPAQFEGLWTALDITFGTGETTRASGVLRNAPTVNGRVVTDHTAQFLEEHGHALGYGAEGQVFIECPWKGGHSMDSGISETAYFPAGGRGYQQGHFKCMHASCAERTDVDFLDAFGVRMAEMEIVCDEEVAEDGEAPPVEYQGRDKHGRPLATLENVKRALRRPDICGVEVCYDAFRDEIIFYGKERRKWERENDTRFTRLRNRLEAVHQFNPIPKEMMRDVVRMVAEDNTIDTAQEWLKSLQWDGVPRCGTFLHDYMGAADTPYTRAVSLYLWTGLAGRTLRPGLKADMVVVLQSPEGFKKTSAIEALAPTPDEFCEIDFSDNDDDNARKMRGVLVAECAELRGLHTRELESIMAFVSRRYEKWVPKYKEFAVTYPRRLMFIGTTNHEQFLTPGRDHRRWLPIRTEREADVDVLIRDRALLWAEARELFMQGGLRWKEAETLAKPEIAHFKIKDAWTDVIADWLDAEDVDGMKPGQRDYLRTLDVAREALGLGVHNLKRQDEMKIADALKALGYEKARVRVRSRRTYVWVPEWKLLV